jgi:hypothetical protein
MAVRPDLQSTPIVGEPRQTPSGATLGGNANSSSVPKSDSLASVADAPTPRVGASIIAESPLDTVPKPNVPAVPTNPTSAVVVALVDGATQTKTSGTPISDAVNELAGSFGGGGGGGGASSEEGGVMEEPKKPNYLVLGLMGLGIYYILKKLL